MREPTPLPRNESPAVDAEKCVLTFKDKCESGEQDVECAVEECNVNTHESHNWKEYEHLYRSDKAVPWHNTRRLV